INPELLNHKKEHPCPFCGGKTRFRYMQGAKFANAPFFCNACGTRTGIQFIKEITGLGFNDAINLVGSYLNCMPVERRQALQANAGIGFKWPDWYKFNQDRLDQIRRDSSIAVSPWQRVIGAQMAELYRYGDNSVAPLFDFQGIERDAILIDTSGEWMTTGGNKRLPDGYHSVFGDKDSDQRFYIAASPETAIKASTSMQCRVICCYTPDNAEYMYDSLYSVDKQDKDPMAIVSSKMEADIFHSIGAKMLRLNFISGRIDRRIFE
ncbi:MAG: primase-helicase zinc-binding domain-containing protein, partial [Rickettsiales bacterium]